MNEQRAGYWQPSPPGNSGQMEASKQFQPKKFKETGQNWLKEQQSQATFTPFKSNTMSRSTTPLPQKETSPKSGTLRPPTKASPFVFEAPQSHSTPKAGHPSQLRPGSAMTMNRDQKLTWGRLPAHPTSRSASAMGQSHTLRPASRQSELHMGNVPGVVSRYPSYCTLPRPEQLDAESLMEMQSHPQFYGQPKIVSRPPSAVPMMPGMASDYIRPPSAYMAPQMTMTGPMANDTTRSQPERDIVNWNTLSTFGSMQVLCSLCIFGLGVARVLQGAKWAIGVELAYSLFVMVAALAGIYAVRTRNYTAAAFSYSLTALNTILAIPPFILGLLPTIPWTFPEATTEWFLNTNEPIEIDLCLSLVIFIQVVLSVVICSSGCRSAGEVCSSINDIKLQNEMQRAFPGHSPLPHKA